jgi:hypothetical protein
MRTLASLILLAQVIILGPLFLLYGQVDPCRALAAEMAQRQGEPSLVGGLLNSEPEIAARRDVAELSSATCLTRIYQSWSERVTGGGGR